MIAWARAGTGRVYHRVDFDHASSRAVYPCRRNARWSVSADDLIDIDDPPPQSERCRNPLCRIDGG